ncbi:hypothetical protein E8E13_001838 [Curvularia kusanoi]|uniref:Pinin/SDK/MemA protein domain-containing protein n=1 Tax=Curvularia kusanoi TaxID=90978 RepID=A0A9P4T5A1_CURKU|nr:hypothetical protein E8E13_001838 [Curvularia kusanoi]
MSGAIASAVVLPDADDSPAPVPPPAAASPSNTLKRRQSSVDAPEDSSVKRARINGSSPTTTTNEPDPSTKPALPQRRERGRERRLFGAVLGALSQATPTSGQKRRSEIEKRQLLARKQEDEESEARKAERLARRRVQRWKEQKRFERQALKTRHDNLFHLAHFLHTETEPHLYYRPWEMSPEEEDRVQAQIAEARETIDRETGEFEAREEEEKAGQRERRASPDAATYGGAPAADAAMTTAGDAGDGAGRAEAGRMVGAEVGSKEGANGRGEHAQDHEMRDEEVVVEKRADEDVVMDARPAEGDAEADGPGKDADEEEVVEAAEDTVIY